MDLLQQADAQRRSTTNITETIKHRTSRTIPGCGARQRTLKSARLGVRQYLTIRSKRFIRNFKFPVLLFGERRAQDHDDMSHVIGRGQCYAARS